MDNLYRIQAVNPELASLLKRLKTIYAICGGEVAMNKGPKKEDFNSKKSALIAQLHNFEKLCEARDTCGLPHDSRDFIRLKNTVNQELNKLTDMLDDLSAQHRKELDKKGSKMTDEEVEARREVFQAIVGEFQQAYKAAKGFSHAGAEENQQGGAGMNVMTLDQLKKGQFAGAGIRTKRQEMTGEQMQKMAMIQEQTAEQDSVLDEISKGLDELKNVAERMQDELQLQDKMLADLESKTDKTQSKLDATNERMADALKKINDKASNFCVYIICLVLLLALGAIAYNFISKK